MTKGNVPGKSVARLLRASLAHIERVRASFHAFGGGPRDRDLNLLCYCVGAPQTKLTHALPRAPAHTHTRARSRALAHAGTRTLARTHAQARTRGRTRDAHTHPGTRPGTHADGRRRARRGRVGAGTRAGAVSISFGPLICALVRPGKPGKSLIPLDKLIATLY